MLPRVLGSTPAFCPRGLGRVLGPWLTIPAVGKWQLIFSEMGVGGRGEGCLIPCKSLESNPIPRPRSPPPRTHSAPTTTVRYAGNHDLASKAMVRMAGFGGCHECPTQALSRSCERASSAFDLEVSKLSARMVEIPRSKNIWGCRTPNRVVTPGKWVCSSCRFILAW